MGPEHREYTGSDYGRQVVDRHTKTEREIMPRGEYVVDNSVKRERKREWSLRNREPRRPKPENSNNLPDGFNFAWL